jgi:serine protease
MRRSHRSSALLPALLLAALAACDAAAPDPTGSRAAPLRAGEAPLLATADAVPGRYVVVLNGGGGEVGIASAMAQQVASAYGGKVHHTYGAALQGFAATLTPEAVAALRMDPRVKYVAQDGMAYPTQTTQPGATWGLDRIDQRDRPLNSTYVYGPTGAGVRVYVIDTGILTTHTEFGTRASVGADFVADGRNGQDCHGHGTHVAGTIAGTTYGVAKAAQVIAVRVFGCTGGAEFSTIIAAIDWVTAHAVKPAVTNMSLGGSVYLPINQAVQASIASGVVYAVAGGNESTDACSRSPASTPEALTVGATASDDTRSSFSNYGTCVDLWAPGTNITSAWWSSTTATNTISGTSMATPHVAGVAALYLQGNPTATPATVATQILATSTPERLTGLLTGSPNRLLFSRLTVEPPLPRIAVNPASLAFTFVRPVAGAAAAVEGGPQAFVSASPMEKTAPEGMEDALVTTASTLDSRFLLSNSGTGSLNWTAVSSQAWLTATPKNGQLATASGVVVTATASAATLAAGTYAATLTLADPTAANSPATVSVTASVVEPVILDVGTPRTGLSGTSGSQRFFAVQVPQGAPSLTIATSGGSGDSDLYVRYAGIPSTSLYDCVSASGTTTDSCQVTLPLPGTYYVMLRGFGSYTGVTIAASSGGPPSAPRNPVGRATAATAINLSWADSSVNETSFSVARRNLVGTSWSAWTVISTRPANTVAYGNTGLTPGGTYQYRLRACNAAGCSEWAEAAPVALPTSPPAPPFGLVAAAATGTSARLTWSDGSTDETSFNLLRSIRNADGTWTPYVLAAAPAANAVTYTNVGLVAGSVYRWQLKACNAAGCSDPTNSGIVTLPLVPAAPTAVAGAVLSTTSIRVTWTDASINETSFTLARAPVSAAGVIGAFTDIATLAPNVVAYNNTGLAAGTYRYRVRACSLAGCSAWLTSASVTIPPAPASPGGVGVTVLSSTQLRVTWTDTGSTETSYQVWRSLRNADGTWPAYASGGVTPANAVQYEDGGLLSGRAYRYQVRACNALGCSAWVPSPVANTPAS